MLLTNLPYRTGKCIAYCPLICFTKPEDPSPEIPLLNSKHLSALPQISLSEPAGAWPSGAPPSRMLLVAQILLANKPPLGSSIFVWILLPLTKDNILASKPAGKGLRFSLPEHPCLWFSALEENLVFECPCSWHWQVKCVLCYAGPLRYLLLTYYILLCQWRFQHSSSSGRTAGESELPTGPLLPTDLLKDLNSHEKNPWRCSYLESKWNTASYWMAARMPSSVTPQSQSEYLTWRSICRHLSQKSYYLWQIAELFGSFVQNLLQIPHVLL